MFVTKEDSQIGDQNVINARHNIRQSLFWQAILATVICVLCVLFIREKPPTPPSASSGHQTTEVFQNIQKVIWSTNALKMVCTFGLVLGFANTYGSIIGIIVNEFAYEDIVSSLFGVAFIIGQIAGAFVFGSIV